MDTVFHYRSKEVVDIVWNLDFSGPIDVYNNSCICESIESRCPCVDLNFCLKYQKKIMKDINNKKAGEFLSIFWTSFMTNVLFFYTILPLVHYAVTCDILIEAEIKTFSQSKSEGECERLVLNFALSHNMLCTTKLPVTELYGKFFLKFNPIFITGIIFQ